MGAGHGHSHGHTHTGGPPPTGTAAAAYRGQLRITLGITLTVLLLEIAGTAITGSLALLADAGHLATDAVGVSMALLAIHFANRPASPRRTYGYAGEWGVCHIGYDGQCIEMPDNGDTDFRDFHLGRTKTSDGYINTGVVTFKVSHRNGKRILSETSEQQHYDNVANAWAAVRLGIDDRGVWFSGVVLPHVTEEDIVLIEATGQVSGEWKRGALRALQAVNTPGFGVQRSEASYDENGDIDLLVACAHGLSDCEPTPAERMAALRQADAEARFETMKKGWV